MSRIEVMKIGHLVLTVRDIAETIEFYTEILGMEKVSFGKGRTALCFGEQKINLHQAGNEFDPRDPDGNLIEVSSYEGG